MLKRINGKLITLACLLIALVSSLSAAISLAFANEEHVHVFTEGKCACGAVRLEAENADLTGSQPSPGNDSNLGTNGAASGGGLVCNWSVAGNKIVWRFSIDKNVTAPMELYLSPCEGATTFSSTLKLTVNGMEVGLIDDNMRGLVGEQWHNYSAFVTKSVTFAKGDVEIALQARKAYNVNIDCLQLDFPAANAVGIGSYSENPAHAHAFVDGRCGCGAALFEAETADLTGSQPSPGNDTNLGTNANAFGGGLVCNWSVAGNKIVWRFSLDKQVDAPISLILSPCEGATTFSSTLKLTVNGTEVGLADDNMRGIVGEGWHEYSAFTTNTVKFDAGNVEIVLEARRAYNVNIDGIIIGFAAVDKVTVGEYAATPVHVHNFVNGKCECGAVRLEAETADLTGSQPSPGNDSNLGTNSAASGGGLVNNWSVTGNKIVWKFSLNKEATAAMGLVLSPCEAATTFSSTLKLTVNGTEVGLIDDNMRGLVGDQWHNYSTFVTENVAFTKGNVEIVLEAKRAYNVNIDCLDIYFATADGIELGDYVPEEPPVPEHTHEFIEGKCTCGAIRLEAENADLTGSQPSFGNDTNLDTNSAASGGGLVCNWSVTGNRIVWRFSLNKDVTAAMGLVLSPCEEATNFSNTLSLTVNGAEVALVDDAIRGIVGEQWHNYSTFLTEEISFGSGNVEIILQSKRAYNVNIDCLDIYFASADGVELRDYVPVIPEHTHAFVDGKCECGAVVLEAESGSIAGTPTGGSGFIEAYENASGGYIVANWMEGDNIATYDFVLSAAAENVKIGFCFAPTAASAGHSLPTTQEQLENKQGPWGFEMRINSSTLGQNAVTWTSSYLPPFDGRNYYAFTTVWTNPVSLNEGANFIQVESWDHYAMNIDYIILELPQGVTLSQESIDRIDPTIGAITIDTEEPKAGNVVTFSFEASDNVTAADRLNVEIKVYLGKVATGNEVAVSGRSFTPAEAGKYYIVVTVTDEAGNKVSRTRTVTVEAASSIEPPEDNNQEENKGSGCFGSLENGLGMFAGLTALGLLACVILIVRLKKRGN